MRARRPSASSGLAGLDDRSCHVLDAIEIGRQVVRDERGVEVVRGLVGVHQGPVDAAAHALGPAFEDLVPEGVGQGLHRVAGLDLVAVAMQEAVQLGEGERAEPLEKALGGVAQVPAAEAAGRFGERWHPAGARLGRAADPAVGLGGPELLVEVEGLGQHGAAAAEPVARLVVEPVELLDEPMTALVEPGPLARVEPGAPAAAGIAVVPGDAGRGRQGTIGAGHGTDLQSQPRVRGPGTRRGPREARRRPDRHVPQPAPTVQQSFRAVPANLRRIAGTARSRGVGGGGPAGRGVGPPV